MYDFEAAISIYRGSDGNATKAMYEYLATIGAAGDIAANLFRAHKCSARAKVYRGGERGRGSYRSMAYGRKEWSISNLCASLDLFAHPLGLRWGWKRDEGQAKHCWVLYVDLPTGQISFHAESRGAGPD